MYIYLGKIKARTGKLGNSFLVCWDVVTLIIFLAETKEDVFFVQGILATKLKRHDFFKLFITLGLSETTVNGYQDIAKLENYAFELLEAWSNEKDDVLIKYPEGATWEHLRKVLTDIGHGGTAKKLE